MKTEPETITMTVTVKLADADGEPIRVGSVLRSLDDGQVGVVTRIIREGDSGPFCSAVGDLVLHVSSGNTRVTNKYSSYRHVPRDEQTYIQRLTAWRQVPYEHDELLNPHMSKYEGLAIDGIMALFPRDPVNWDFGPFPNTLDDALEFMARHLAELAKEV